MPERIDLRRPKAKLPTVEPEPPLAILRPQAGLTRSVELEAAVSVSRESAAELVRADVERTTILGKLARQLGLPAAPTPTPSETLAAPGATIRLSLDNSRVNCFNPEHFYRAADGQGSYVHLRRGTSDDYSGYVAFTAVLPPGSIGVYLAILNVDATIPEVKLEVTTLPDGGGFYATSKRTGTKFLCPFELTLPTDGLSFGITFPIDVVGDLKVYSVDISKVI
ncbi:MAG: hypothetical protein IPO88_29370 [Nannocystis sp.]|uniref:hypothetical protein n=1 Tax=Nannocystis sp. TaxID=1962667 RepID=UPI002422A669|nr:hypothetical protein [Nannocystis sp.]MBK9757542.1 hypothetical protein [Nannocystis sp.]